MKAWIAKDKNGWVGLYRTRPRKGYDMWIDAGTICQVVNLPEGCDPKWTDEEPIKVEVTITKV